MAGIVVVTEFKTAGGGVKYADYLGYIDRDSATRKDAHRDFQGYLDYMDNQMKTTLGVELVLHDEKQSALYTKDRDKLSLDEKRMLREQFISAQEKGSNLWETVISFDNAFLGELGLYDADSGYLNEDKMRRVSRKAINAMLEKEGLENAIWTASFHYNTDNIHIHIATVEPVPMREKKLYRQWERNEDGEYKLRINEKTGKEEKIPVLDKNGDQVFAPELKGSFKQSSLRECKRVLAAELSEDKELSIKITQMLRGIVKEKREMRLMDAPDFEEKLLSLYFDLKSSGTTRKNWYYNRNTLSELRPKLDVLSELFLDTYYKEEMQELKAEMEKQEKIYQHVYGGSNEYLLNKLYDKNSGLYTRLGNAILAELKAYDCERMSQLAEVKKAAAYLDKKNSDYDATRGLKELKALSDRGNVFAQTRLGKIYLEGEVVSKDLNEAQKYFEKAAANGDPFAIRMTYELKKNSPMKRGRAYPAYNKDFRRAARHLKRSLTDTAESWRNQMEFERLQMEIEQGGSTGLDL